MKERKPYSWIKLNEKTISLKNLLSGNDSIFNLDNVVSFTSSYFNIHLVALLWTTSNSSYLRLYLSIETVSCCLLLRMARMHGHGLELEKIHHFRVPKTLTFKVRLGAHSFLWKWVLFAWEWKMISISRAKHLPSFWNRGPGELGNGLLGIFFAPLPCVCSAKSGTRATGGCVTDVCHFHQRSGT